MKIKGVRETHIHARHMVDQTPHAHGIIRLDTHPAPRRRATEHIKRPIQQTRIRASTPTRDTTLPGHAPARHRTLARFHRYTEASDTSLLAHETPLTFADVDAISLRIRDSAQAIARHALRAGPLAGHADLHEAEIGSAIPLAAPSLPPASRAMQPSQRALRRVQLGGADAA